MFKNYDMTVYACFIITIIIIIIIIVIAGSSCRPQS